MSILALAYVFFFNYSPEENNTQIIILILITFFFGILFLSEKKDILLTISLSLIISLYICEVITYKIYEPKLATYERLNKKIAINNTDGRKFETRSTKEYFDYYKSNINNYVVVSLHPSLFIEKNNLEIFPLGGIKNRETIHCNENGYFSIYKSDRYGFNNQDKIWDEIYVNYLILGDSFVHGRCVNEPDTISGNLKKKNLTIKNLGWNGSGPLIQYAILKEFFPDKEVKKVVWFFYENDFNDLKKEMKNKILLKYKNNEKFIQNLKNSKKAEKIKIEIFNEKLRSSQLHYIKKEKNLKDFFLYVIKTDIAKMIKFYHLRNIINQLSVYEEYENILKKVKVFSNKKDAELYLVYLPSFQTVMEGRDNDNFYEKKLKHLSEKHQINFININKILFKNNVKDPLKYFAHKHSHYNEIGYAKIANMIFDQTK